MQRRVSQSQSLDTDSVRASYKGVRLIWRGRAELSFTVITGRRQHLIMAAGAGTET